MKEPPHTCALIDEGKRLCRMVVEAVRHDHIERSYVEYLLSTIDAQLEEIRSANEKLREWGQWQEEKCEELQDEIYALEDRLETTP